MLNSKAKAQPSHYPLWSFHIIRICSLLSSMVVSAILLYFCYHLRHDNYKIPWTFVVLLAVSLLTFVSLLLTFLLHICHVLSPLFNLFINIPLLLLWSLGVGLLGWNVSGALGHVCNSDNWGSTAGVMVCRIYKALFSFAIFGWISALAQVILDFRVRKRQTSRGLYNQMGDHSRKFDSDIKLNDRRRSIDSHGAPEQVIPEINVEPYRNEGHEPDNYYGAPQTSQKESVRVDHFGYSAPAEQTSYDSGHYNDRH